jgi:hypothetical protein
MSKSHHQTTPTCFVIIDDKVFGCFKRTPSKEEVNAEKRIYSNNGQSFDVVLKNNEVSFLIHNRKWVMEGKKVINNPGWL